MRELLRANVRAHARRYVATGLAVAISMAFVLVSLMFSQGMQADVTRSITNDYQGVSAVVTLDYDRINASVEQEDTDAADQPQSGEAARVPDPATDLSAVAARIADLPGVGTVGTRMFVMAEATSGGNRSMLVVTATQPAPLYTPPVTEGRAPTRADETAIDSSLAANLNVAIGQTLAVRDFGTTDAPSQLTVTGFIEPTSSAMGSTILMTPEGITAHFPSHLATEVLVAAQDSATPSLDDQDALTADLSQAMADNSYLIIRPAHHVVATRLEEMQMGSGAMTAMVLVFPAIAVLVASIVVSTTFQVILQQRRRELALLRTLGARSGQVRGLIIRETLVVGAVSSVVGVVLGAILGAVGLVWLNFASSIPQALAALNPLTALGVWAAGTLLTFLVGVRPALCVAKIPPIAALAPINEGDAPSRRTPPGRL